jgi:hypothetical protein
VLVLLSNLGVVGAGLFSAFLAYVFGAGRGATGPVSPITTAARHAVAAGLAGSLLAASVFDLGVAFYAFAAAASLPARSPRHTAPTFVPQRRDERALAPG